MRHASAIIDPTAELDTGVVIGPYSIIGPRVQIGAGTRIGPHVVIKSDTQIGRDNEVYQFASIGEDPQDRKYQGEASQLIIGDRNQIRECCTIHRGTEQDVGVTEIGNDNLLMAYTHVAHDCRIGDQVVMANGASLGGHVQLEDWVVLGGFAMVRQFCQIGTHSFVAMGASVRKDVVPYMLVEGVPAILRGINREGLKRRGFSSDQISALKQAYRLLASGQLLTDVMDELTTAAEHCAVLQPIVAFLQSERRGCSVLRKPAITAG
jgi:UDP-N-acetylglucosamine acyltransferase